MGASVVRGSSRLLWALALRQAGEQPVAFAELRAGGIDFPAAVVSELELNGYAIERVYDDRRLVGVRLVHRESRETRAAPRRRRRPWPWPQR
jgi:hypothetical protein